MTGCPVAVSSISWQPEVLEEPHANLLGEAKLKVSRSPPARTGACTYGPAVRVGRIEPGLPAVHVQLDAAALDVNEGVVGGHRSLCEDTGDPRLSLQLVPHVMVDTVGVVGVLAVVQT